MGPVYYALLASAVAQFSVVHWIVLFSILAPVMIALSQSLTSAFLYLLYLPWFLVLNMFFLVFIPAYSFARLWDTTWGNRETARDGSINSIREALMKKYVFMFICFLIALNVILSFILCVFLTGSAQLALLLFLFSPTIIQILGSLFFLLVVRPFRSLMRPGKNSAKSSKPPNI